MKRVLLITLTAVLSTTLFAENKCQTLYLFGFAASFNDSTVCFTDIQQVDSAYIDGKTKFLVERENYSYQLKNYLKEHGWTAPTCVTCYAKSRSDAEKKFVAMRKNYIESKRYTIKYLASSEFKYTAITPTEVTYVTSGDNTASEPSDKKAKDKKSKKDKRPDFPEGSQPQGERPMGPPPGGMR